MNKPLSNPLSSNLLLWEIAKIIGAQENISEQHLRKRAKLDSGAIPKEFLAQGPNGEPHHVLNSWIALFVGNPVLAYRMHPEALNYIDWGSVHRHRQVRHLFVEAKKITAKPRQRIAEPSPEDKDFARLLQYVINKSGIFDHKAAPVLNIDKRTLSRYFSGDLPIPQDRIEDMIVRLEADLAGPRKIFAYAQYRDRLHSFLLPEPAEDCPFNELLKHLIIKSRLPHGKAATLLEVRRNALTQILQKGATQIRTQKIVSTLELDHEGRKEFSAYEKYRERFLAFVPTAETFEQLTGRVIVESGATIAVAAAYFGISYHGLQLSVGGEENMRALTRQIVFDRFEEDLTGEKLFEAYEKYRESFQKMMRTDEPDDAFHILLRRTIMESHRSIAFAAEHFGMAANTLTVNLRNGNRFTREVGQKIIAVLKADSNGKNEFPAYAKYQDKLTDCAVGLRTYFEMKSEAARKKLPTKKLKEPTP